MMMARQTARRIVLDSDDEDDFPSLRKPVLTLARPAGPAKTNLMAATPKPKRSALTGKEATETPKSTTVRRRKLGAINNDAALFRPWDALQKTKLDQASITDFPSERRRQTRRPKPQMELRTRKTRRVSEVPDDNKAELSTEEASVLEEDTLLDSGSEDGNHSSDGHSDDHSDDDFSLSAESSDGEFSLDSFLHSPSKKRPQRTTRATQGSQGSTLQTAQTLQTRQTGKAKGGKTGTKMAVPSLPPPASNELLNQITEEDSSIFFSAEESLSALTLDDPSMNLPTIQRPKTPPRPATPKKQEQEKEQKPAGLVSPTKRLPHIPQTPHRPSGDDFWNQQIIDDWNMEHSPRKLLFDDSALRKKKSAAATSPKKQLAATAKEKKEAAKAFQKSKHAIAEAFLAELDRVITDGELGRLTESTGGVSIVWNNKLKTTAGQAKWRRETLRPVDKGAATTVRHHAYIQLADKVVDDEERLLNVIAHEFCHLANFMVSNVTDQPHGRQFKAWGAKCSRHFGDRGIEVTTKHSYDIDFKYVWSCAACATEYKRHSKSIDPSRHRCGVCKGTLQQIKPVPRGKGKNASGVATASVGSITAGNTGTTNTTGSTSAYQQFMKDHMAAVRRENPGSPQKDIMKLVADKWTQAKAAKKAEAEKASVSRSSR